MKKDIKIFIGVDPDVDKSGYAIWDKETKEFDLYTKTFAEMLEDIELFTIPVHLVIEAGFLIKKSNWHGAKTKNIASKIGKNVGANHQVGKCLSEFCIYKGISYEFVKPKGKLDHFTFKKITGYKARTNQEKRDAGMLVYEI